MVLIKRLICLFVLILYVPSTIWKIKVFKRFSLYFFRGNLNFKSVLFCLWVNPIIRPWNPKQWLKSQFKFLIVQDDLTCNTIHSEFTLFLALLLLVFKINFAKIVLGLDFYRKFNLRCGQLTYWRNTCTRGIWKVLSMVFIYKPYHVWYHFKELPFFFVIAQISLFEPGVYFNIKWIGELPGPTNEFERSLVFERGEFERPKFDCIGIFVKRTLSSLYWNQKRFCKPEQREDNSKLFPWAEWV